MPPRAWLHAARLIVKPKPSTLSESFAILRTLRTLGEVTKFIKHTGPLAPQEIEGTPFEDGREIVYNVEFSSIQQKLRDLIHNDNVNSLTKSLKFKVEANGNHPDPQDLDPYNVRGLLDRKPNLSPSKFTCKLMLRSIPDIATTADTLAEEETDGVNRYSGSFSVDDSSVLAKVFHQTDTPRHLVAGLSPLVSDTDYPAGHKDEFGRPMNSRLRRVLRGIQRKQAKTSIRKGHENFSLKKLYEEGLQRRNSRQS